MKAEARDVIKASAKTPGFIMLERLHKAAGRNLKNQERDLWRLIKKHYALVKKEQHAANKASGRMVLLKGDLKRRAQLSEKLRCAGRAIVAARHEQGPQIFGSVSKAMESRRILEGSPEFRAVKHLQRVCRRTLPLKFHPGLGPSRPLDVPLHRVWAAHVVLCRCAKARAMSDMAFLARFFLRHQIALLSAGARGDAEDVALDARLKLRHLYANSCDLVPFVAGVVLDRVCKRALLNGQWKMCVWAGQVMGRMVHAVFPHQEYNTFPAICPQVSARSVLVCCCGGSV